MPLPHGRGAPLASGGAHSCVLSPPIPGVMLMACVASLGALENGTLISGQMGHGLRSTWLLGLNGPGPGSGRTAATRAGSGQPAMHRAGSRGKLDGNVYCSAVLGTVQTLLLVMQFAASAGGQEGRVGGRTWNELTWKDRDGKGHLKMAGAAVC